MMAELFLSLSRFRVSIDLAFVATRKLNFIKLHVISSTSLLALPLLSNPSYCLGQHIYIYLKNNHTKRQQILNPDNHRPQGRSRRKGERGLLELSWGGWSVLILLSSIDAAMCFGFELGRLKNILRLERDLKLIEQCFCKARKVLGSRV